jgi:hypothetical protein
VLTSRRASEGLPRLIAAAGLAVAKPLATAFSIEPFFKPRHPKYNGKAMRIRAMGYFAMLGGVPALWLARGRQEPYPVIPDLALSVPLLLDAGGNSLGLYDRARVDAAVHFTNSIILSSAFGEAIGPHVEHRWEAAALTVGFGVTGETAWEIMEYTALKLGFQGLQLSYENTMDDVVLGFAGALIAGAVTWKRWKPREERERLAREARDQQQRPQPVTSPA